MITTVIFDMNGIIVDDEHIHELIFLKIMKPHGVNLNHQDYIELCAGRTDREGFEKILERYKVQTNITTLLDQKHNLYIELFKYNKVAYPGVLPLVKELSKEFKLALASGSIRSEVEIILKEFDIYNYFGAIITADDIHKGKPDPEPYLKAAEKIHSDPKECVVIEDSTSGIKSATNAGMKCIGVTTTHPAESLKESTIVVKNFEYISTTFIKYLD